MATKNATTWKRTLSNACCTVWLITVLTALVSGCGSREEIASVPDSGTTSEPSGDPDESDENSPGTGIADAEPQIYSISEEQLLAARLTDEESSAGWVRLFDGHTLFGWEISGQANFRVEDETIVVDEGDVCLMCTSSTWGDFELTLEFNAEANTNSGVFVRTPMVARNPAEDCYEINIAPDDNPFPTGSIVQRQKVDAEAAGPQTPGQWRTMTIIADGRDVVVKLDQNEVCRYTDSVDLPARQIGLQHNSGRVAFRNIKIRPLGFQPLFDAELAQWQKYPEMPGEFTINEDGDLHVVGGRAQLETKESFGDFFLLSQYRIDQPNMNSGIFFRCIPGDEMMGYECQINNDYEGDSRLSPLDCGTGGIFRRQDARFVAGDNGKWSTVLLHAAGNKITAWVNGVQVSDWVDTRPPHENPRKGSRTEPGTIMIQGHDPGTDVLFREMGIISLD